MIEPLTVLGLETSCDETAAAVVRLDASGAVEVLSSIVGTQIAAHAPYGGVVPEIAARAHVDMLDGIVRAAMTEADIDHTLTAADDAFKVVKQAGPLEPVAKLQFLHQMVEA